MKLTVSHIEHEPVREGLHSYISRGTPPGDFLEAAIKGELFEVFKRMDDLAYANLREIVRVILAMPMAMRDYDYWLSLNQDERERILEAIKWGR